MAEPVVASGGAPEGRQHAGSFPKGNTFGTAHRFRPGQSGNPGGTSNYIEHTRAMALRAVPEAMQLLIRIAGDPKADLSYRIRCAETILDRVLSKPAQSVNILAAVAHVDLASMSDLELLAHVTRLRAAAELPSRELPECSAPVRLPDAESPVSMRVAEQTEDYKPPAPGEWTPGVHSQASGMPDP